MENRTDVFPFQLDTFYVRIRIFSNKKILCQ